MDSLLKKYLWLSRLQNNSEELTIIVHIILWETNE